MARKLRMEAEGGACHVINRAEAGMGSGFKC